MRREQRLTASKEYRQVYKRGRTGANKDLVAYYARREDERVRVGFSVSKRLGPAVTRNRIRRLLKEAVRHNEARIQPGYDIVLIARQPIKGKSFHEVEKTFIDILIKTGLLKKSNEEDSDSIY